MPRQVLHKRLRTTRRVVGTELSNLRDGRRRRELLLPEIPGLLRLPPERRKLLVDASDYSLLSLKRLLNLLRLASSMPGSVQGGLAEFGVARGGSAGLLGTVAAEQGRPLWLFDSFQGLPAPGERDGDEAWALSGGRSDGALEPIGHNEAAVDEVRAVLTEVFGLDSERIRFVAGWFQETRPEYPDEPLALMHVDGDWYESVKFVLEAYFDLVSPGGVVVFDDYGWWEGCRAAVDEFLAARGIGGLERCGSQAYLRVE